MEAYITMIMLGGMTGPRTAALAITAPLKSSA
jgi:hypothetical protein